eukprot:jgi/Picsp_1/3871/NSC_01383-R1_fad-dependent oxidase
MYGLARGWFQSLVGLLLVMGAVQASGGVLDAGADGYRILSSVGMLECLVSNGFGHGDQARENGTVVALGLGAALDDVYDASKTWASSRETGQLAQAVVYPRTVDDVVAAVKCGMSYESRMSVVSGRHSYQAVTVPSNSILIDVSKMCSDKESIVVDVKDRVLSVPAGCRQGAALGALTEVAEMNPLLVLGNCALVGLGGLILGGGQGDVSPYVGLACDQVKALEMVLYNGSVIRASKNEYPDIFWASCGGGGGLGVVTRMDIGISEAPDPDHFTRFELFYPIEKSAEALVRLQKLMQQSPGSSSNGSSTARPSKWGGSGVVGPAYQFQQGLILNLLYLGAYDQGVEELQETGMLSEDVYPNTWITKLPNELYLNFSKQQAATAELPSRASMRIVEYPSYAYAIAATLIQEGVGVNMTVACRLFSCNFLSQFDATNKENLDQVLRWTRNLSSPLLDPEHELWSKRSFTYPAPGYMISGFDNTTWQALVDVATNPPTMDGAGLEPACSSFYFLLAHFTGGKSSMIASNATAYPWRAENILFTYLNGADPYQWEACQTVKEAYDNVLQGFENKGYYNYMGPPTSIPNWQEFYWGANYDRLQRIKAKYDPFGYFTKEMTPSGTSS